jgi:hypothetical protein
MLLVFSVMCSAVLDVSVCPLPSHFTPLRELLIRTDILLFALSAQRSSWAPRCTPAAWTSGPLPQS